MCIRDRSKDDPATVADCLDKIDHSSQYLLSILNDILDMSKICLLYTSREIKKLCPTAAVTPGLDIAGGEVELAKPEIEQWLAE